MPLVNFHEYDFEGFRIESIQQTCLPFSIIYANQLKGAKTSLFEWFEYYVPFVNYELNQNKFEKAKLELPLWSWPT